VRPKTLITRAKTTGLSIFLELFFEKQAISYFLPDQQFRLNGPATPITQRLLAMTRNRFGLFPFRSPLLLENNYFPSIFMDQCGRTRWN
jgi:hypothetical protein